MIKRIASLTLVGTLALAGCLPIDPVADTRPRVCLWGDSIIYLASNRLYHHLNDAGYAVTFGAIPGFGLHNTDFWPNELASKSTNCQVNIVHMGANDTLNPDVLADPDTFVTTWLDEIANDAPVRWYVPNHYVWRDRADDLSTGGRQAIIDAIVRNVSDTVSMDTFPPEDFDGGLHLSTAGIAAFTDAVVSDAKSLITTWPTK